MSDGAISQDEIDALLAGVDMGGISPSNSSSSSANIDVPVIETFTAGLTDNLKTNLKTMTDANFEIGTPIVETVERDEVLKKLPEVVVYVTSDFKEGLIGEHIFVLAPEFAQKITGLVNKEENPEIDGMALSVISEIVSQHSGYEITQLSQTGKLPGLSSEPARADNAPKAMIRFPQGRFVLVSYPVTIEGGAFTLWEALSPEVAEGISRTLGGGSSDNSIGGLSAAEMANIAGMSAPMGGGMGAMGGMPQMGGMNGMPQMGGMPTMGGMPQMGGMPAMGGMNGMPAMNMGGMSNPLATPPNVQALQFPNLTPGLSGMEQGNIGLIMDVNMEMTVELGRTRKLIKDILGMGEGTIIELDKLAGEPVDILVNHKAIAKGEVVVIDENFGVRVTEILSPMERVADLH